MKSETISQNINFKCSFCYANFSSFCLPYLSCKNCHCLCEKCFYQIKNGGRSYSLCPLCNLPVFEEIIINKGLLRQIQAVSKYQQLQLKYEKAIRSSQIKNQQVSQSSQIKNQPSIYIKKDKDVSKLSNFSPQLNQVNSNSQGEEISKFLKQNNLTIMGAFIKMISQIVKIISSVGLILVIFFGSYMLWQYINTQKDKKPPQIQAKWLFFIANTIAITLYAFWNLTATVYKLLYPVIFIGRSIVQHSIYGLPISYAIQYIVYLTGYYDKLYFNLLIEPVRNSNRQYIILGVTFVISWIVLFYHLSKKMKENLKKVN